MGDIDALAASIAEHGLLNPITVKPDGMLIAGERRLEAVRQLGWTMVPVTVLDPADLLKAEFDENTVRLNFAPSEAVAIAKELRPIEEAQAKERQRAGGGIPGCGKLTQPEPRTRDRLAAAVGMSAGTLVKAVAVVDAAEADPEMGDLVSKMDDTGKVDAAYRELEHRKRLVAVASTVTVGADGQRYRAVVVDPAWDLGGGDPASNNRPTTSTMTIAEMTALLVADLADPSGCHLYLWISNRSLPKGFGLLKAWGFEYAAVLTWCKPSGASGDYFRDDTEHVLFGVRGSLAPLEKDAGTWFEAEPPMDSAKPEEFFEMVRRLSPGPRLAMFAQGEHDGFVAWGAEAAAPANSPIVGS
jgi:N6-adenosine-specific RNA methylase IME4